MHSSVCIVFGWHCRLQESHCEHRRASGRQPRHMRALGTCARRPGPDAFAPGRYLRPGLPDLQHRVDVVPVHLPDRSRSVGRDPAHAWGCRPVACTRGFDQHVLHDLKPRSTPQSFEELPTTCAPEAPPRGARVGARPTALRRRDQGSGCLFWVGGCRSRPSQADIERLARGSMAERLVQAEQPPVEPAVVEGQVSVRAAVWTFLNDRPGSVSSGRRRALDCFAAAAAGRPCSL